MKSAIYLADGVTQIVLTAESEWEKAVLAHIEDASLTVFRGGFYECRGGWIRESAIYHEMHGVPRSAPESVMLRINKTVQTPEFPQ